MKKRIATHRQTWIVWIVCLFAIGFGAVATIAILDRGGAAFDYALVAFIWLVVAVFVPTAIKSPLYAAFLETDGCVSFVWQYPHRRVTRIVEAAVIPAPEIVSARDSDGDRHFTAKITFADGVEFIIAEPGIQTGQSQKTAKRQQHVCERACARFSDAISQA